MTKIILCFDGTSNDPSDARQETHLTGRLDDSSITNVLKLHLLLGGDLKGGALRGDQRSFYYPGVGTYGSKARRIVNSLFSPDHMDVAQIIRSGLADVRKNYQEGDELFIFGFSRGAAIARRFAAVVRDKLGKPNLAIRFVGVFDTVASIGKPNLDEDDKPVSDVVFENNFIAPSIQEAVHLVSLDDRRKAFMPTLMNHDDRVTETWFAGAHSDVGGGYRQDGLSDITLQYLLDQMRTRDLGLEILADHEIDYGNLLPADAEFAIDHDDVAIQPNPSGINHQQQRPPLTARTTLTVRHLRVNESDRPSTNHRPLVHRSVAQRIASDDTYRPDALRGRPHDIAWPSGTIQYAGLRDHSFQAPVDRLRVGDSRVIECTANLLFNPTGIAVGPGEKYVFEVDMRQTWKDASIKCNAAGWTRATEQLGWREGIIWMLEDNRRLPEANWFALCGTVGRDDSTAFQLLEHLAAEHPFEPGQRGEIHLFANDVEDKYQNNSGRMEARIRRIE